MNSLSLFRRSVSSLTKSMCHSRIEATENLTSISLELPKPIPLSSSRYDNILVDPNRPPILIYHGLLGSKSEWFWLSQKIGDETFRTVYALDVRNHGESGHSNEWSSSALVSDAVNFMRNLDISRAILIGHGFGASAFMKLASLFPEKVEKLVMIDGEPSEFHYPSAIKYGRILQSLKSATLQASLKQSHSEGRKIIVEKSKELFKDPASRESLLMNLSPDLKSEFRWNFNLQVLSESTSFSETKTKTSTSSNIFKGPSLFIRGENAPEMDAQSYNLITKNLSAISTSSIQGAGLCVHSEKPAELVQVLKKFINS